MATYLHGTSTVTTTAAILTSVAPENDGLLLVNSGAGVVYVGGPTVTANQTATGGFPVAVNQTVSIPSVGGASYDLYAVTATGTSVVSWIQP
jgi:hypothetical protein